MHRRFSNFTTLQNIDLDAPLEVELLHFKFDAKQKGVYPSRKDDGIAFRKGSTVNFDTLFGSFYESDWFSYTALENVVLRISVSGEYSATVYRKTSSDDIYVVGRAESSEDKLIYLPFAKSRMLPNVPSRMWLVIEALSDITIHKISWVTHDEPVQKDVALGVCFATFNRLPYLKRVVNDLLSNEEAFGSVASIILVNQGDNFSLEELVEEKNKSKTEWIKLIRQDNFGGCGGFTRGIIEAMGDEELTHVLLCDDDIVFESHSIIRLTSFIKYCHDDVAVGGQMLDILRPNFLYESGAVLREKTLKPQPLGHQMFLGDPKTLDYLISSSRVDYNGWWYFAFSKKVVERVALPIPCFIRGDDIEYGIRLKKNDIHTVVLPGVVVWHEPFYMKLGGWHYYYELRNRLILQALHYKRNIRKDLTHLTNIFVRDILTCRYYTAKLAILAMEDFLAGPKTSMTCDPKKLAEVRQLAERYGPSLLIGDYIPSEKCALKRGTKLAVWWKTQDILTFISNLLGIPNRSQKQCYIPARMFNIANTRGLKEFVVREMDNETFRMFRRSHKTFVGLLMEYVRVRGRLKKAYPTLISEYQTAAKSYTSLKHWRSILGIEDQ